MTVISCSSDSDCDFNFYCSSDQTCLHSSVWPPTALDVITYLIVPLIVGVGNVGGLGGGIVKVPLIMLMLNYDTKVATFISYCILFGSCLANSTLLIFKKHPTQDKPIIDYNIVLMINPMVLLGTNIGIFLNILLPEIAAGILFICFLTSVSPYMFKKGLHLYKLKKEQETSLKGESLLDNDQEKQGNKSQVIYYKQDTTKVENSVEGINYDSSINDSRLDEESDLQNEINAKNQQNAVYNNSRIKDKQNTYNPQSTYRALSRQQQIEEQVAMERSSSYFQPEETNQESVLRTSSKALRQSMVEQKKSFAEGEETEELEEFYKEEYKQVPTKKLILLVVVFISVQMLVFIRGGKGLKSFIGVTTCTTSYWITNAGILLVAVAAIFVIRFFLLKWEKNKKIMVEKYNLQEEFAGDLDFTNGLIYAKISLAGLTAGMLAGTFGVGAGLALVPILLAQGVQPQVAAATCGFNYFFISTTTIIQVFTNNYLNVEQIILFSILAFIGGFFCAKLIYSFVEKKKASYLIIFMVLGLAILNIISFIIYLSKKGVRYGWDSLVSQIPFCEAQ